MGSTQGTLLALMTRWGTLRRHHTRRLSDLHPKAILQCTRACTHRGNLVQELVLDMEVWRLHRSTLYWSLTTIQTGSATCYAPVSARLHLARKRTVFLYPVAPIVCTVLWYFLHTHDMGLDLYMIWRASAPYLRLYLHIL